MPGGVAVSALDNAKAVLAHPLYRHRLDHLVRALEALVAEAEQLTSATDADALPCSDNETREE